MEDLYIINKEAYNGTVIATMRVGNIDLYHDKPILGGKKTFNQLNAEHNGKLIALHWDKFYDEYYEPYLTSLQKPFKEITEDEFFEALECLPPLRLTSFKGGEFFFVSEPYTASIHDCYVKKDGKYYSALRSIYEKPEKIIELSIVD